MQNQKSIDETSFRTISVIGKGSYAKVLLVRKNDTGNLYAMKILKKKMVEQKKQEAHVENERNILVGVNQRPFLIDLYYAFQTKDKLHFVLEYCPGGELFHLLSKKSRLSEDHTRFYAAQMLVALEHLHNQDIVYRDLKPENVLLDAQGYIKITDFGLSRRQIKMNEAKSICGTPEYLAPEIIQKKGYGKAVDWWTLGSIIFEMLTGVPPFYDSDRHSLFYKILNEPPKYPKDILPVTCDLLKGLLQKNPDYRLGIHSASQIKEHPWFNGINWEDLKKKLYQPPFTPKVGDNMGLNNFDSDFTEIPAQSPGNFDKVEYVETKNYSNFSYNVEDNIGQMN